MHTKSKQLAVFMKANLHVKCMASIKTSILSNSSGFHSHLNGHTALKSCSIVLYAETLIVAKTTD